MLGWYAGRGCVVGTTFVCETTARTVFLGHFVVTSVGAIRRCGPSILRFSRRLFLKPGEKKLGFGGPVYLGPVYFMSVVTPSFLRFSERFRNLKKTTELTWEKRVLINWFLSLSVDFEWRSTKAVLVGVTGLEKWSPMWAVG